MSIIPDSIGQAIGSTSEVILLTGASGVTGTRLMVNNARFYNDSTTTLKAKLFWKRTPSERMRLLITGGPTGGTFTITYSGQTTAGIAYNSTAAQVQAALEALSNIAPGDIGVIGGPLPYGEIIIFFLDTGTLKFANQTLMTTNSASLTGGSTPAATISAIQDGSGTKVSIPLGFVALDAGSSGYGGFGTVENPSGSIMVTLTGYTDVLCAQLDTAPTGGNALVWVTANYATVE